MQITQGRAPRRPELLLALLGLCVGAHLACGGAGRWAGPSPAGVVEGRLLAPSTGPGPGRVVVYLEALEAPAQPTPRGVADVDELGESQPLLAVAKGQRIRFQGGDVFHRFFSYAEGNAFDLGLSATGEAPTVALEHPGVVRFYCSLHPWESGTIFVAPSPHFAMAKPPVRYRIDGVPPGRYRLQVWGETVHDEPRGITVRDGQVTSVEIRLRSADQEG